MVKREVYIGLWLGDLMERDHLGDIKKIHLGELGVDGNIILKWAFK
jgi:hypothetical protein